MVAGEYAVLEPNHPSLVMAVDRYVYVTVEASKTNCLTLKNFHLENLSWSYANQQISLATKDPKASFVKDAMLIALRYLEEQGIKLKEPIHIIVRSDLEDASGIKYGLGSSAAVVVAVIASLLHYFMPKNFSKEELFKLAAISHVSTQGSGSGADIVASTYGGLLKYTSFQADWLQEARQKQASLTPLLKDKWPYLTIEPLPSLPVEAKLCIGWTGHPASTSSLIEQVSTVKKHQTDQYELFLSESKRAVYEITTGFLQAKLPKIFTGIERNQQALAKLGEKAKVTIETPLLKKLAHLAKETKGAGKLSGAGGGDCGIAIVPSFTDAEQLIKKWEQVGITPLNLSKNKTGATLLT